MLYNALQCCMMLYNVLGYTQVIKAGELVGEDALDGAEARGHTTIVAYAAV